MTETEDTALDGQLITSDKCYLMEYESAASQLQTPIDISLCNDTSPRYRVKALWDTGASTSCISERMARMMKLQPIAIEESISATDQMNACCYFVDAYLSDGMPFRNLEVTGLPLTGLDTDFLIGMDIISKGKFTVESVGGKTVIRFEMK